MVQFLNWTSRSRNAANGQPPQSVALWGAWPRGPFCCVLLELCLLSPLHPRGLETWGSRKACVPQVLHGTSLYCFSQQSSPLREGPKGLWVVSCLSVFCWLCFWYCIQEITAKSWSSSPTFSSRSWIVLGLTFESLILSELISVCDVR